MTRMMQQHGSRLEATRFTPASRLALTRQRARRIKNMVGIPLEVFPPIALLSALAIYLVVVAAVGGGTGGAP